MFRLIRVLLFVVPLVATPAISIAAGACCSCGQDHPCCDDACTDCCCCTR